MLPDAILSEQSIRMARELEKKKNNEKSLSMRTDEQMDLSTKE